MKAGLLLWGSGALIYLTTHRGYMDQALLEKFRAKGISKFIAYEIPIDKVKERYASHFDIVAMELKDADDLRVLDYDGTRAFNAFSFGELGSPFTFES
jgi:predicted ABC-type ATPase